MNLKKRNGLDILINFLDSQLMKDEVSDSLEKFEEFEDFQRAKAKVLLNSLPPLIPDIEKLRNLT